MAAANTLQRLIELSAKRFEVEPASIAPDADVFESLGIDSVQVLELLSELEIEFDVEIPDYGRLAGDPRAVSFEKRLAQSPA